MNINAPHFILDARHVALRKTIQQFCTDSVKTRAAQIDQEDHIPKEIWTALGALGAHGLTISESYGGLNLGYVAHAVAMEEISRASASVGLSYAAHSNLCMNQIQLFGTEEQKKHFLPPLCRGEAIGSLAMTEKNAGSDIVGMSLHAEPCGAGFILNGRKMWITNAPCADVFVVYAKTDPEFKSKGMSAFLIERGIPGFFTTAKRDKLGMRGSDTGELIFDQCFIPESSLLGPRNQGVRLLMQGLDYERLILSAGPVGIMQACLDLVLPHVRQRHQFHKKIGEFQLIQAKLADLYTMLNSSRAYLYALAAACDTGCITQKDSASLFLYTSECATQAALQTVQCFGAYGYMNECAASRLLRDAKLYEIGAGTTEIRRWIIGRTLFEEDDRGSS